MQEKERKLVDYAVFGDVENVTNLLSQGVDINTLHCSSFPLFEAVSKGNYDLVGLLLSYPSLDINRYERSTGYNALHAAIFYSQYIDDSKILKSLLLDPRINIVLPCKAPLTLGYSPLHLSAYIGNKAALELLIEAGANPCQLTEEGLSIYDVAGQSASCSSGNEEIITLIRHIIAESYEEI